MNDVVLFLITYILGTIPVLFIWVLIHELGHALGAWLVGFRVSSFSVGPFFLVLQDGKYHFRYVKHTRKSYFGRVHPLIHGIHTDKQYHSLRGKVALVAIAGPLLEWASIIAFILLSRYIPNQTIAVTLLTIVISFSILTLLGSSEIAAAVQMFMGHELLLAGHIYIWSIYSNDSDKESNRFIVTKLLQQAEQLEQLRETKKTKGYLSYCHIMLELYLADYIQALPASLEKSLAKFIRELNDKPAEKKVRQEQLALSYLFITYRIVSGANKQKAEQWFYSLEKRYQATSEDAVYQHKRARHFIGIVDELSELNNRTYIPPFFYCETGYENLNRRINNRSSVSI
ncbi:M50 family metallopeptidase [Bacillus sp. FJAT-26390]|uniref:M50 family metallopeptidase n=1 Tax=Bacillus sp. FJAT-26390 TaxID=1743142 RepID=UPI000807E754|nr:M50 family metallopeptidase [Bacillus sp. FJAT-26390]OBZ10120.1 hypothetical protein A7975_22435 [Bacillus sp. FJAT-26390]